jgi:hypothetical protein
MKSLQKSPAEPYVGDRSPNDLDGRLRAFFRAQMPQPWPVLQPPVTTSLAQGRAAARGRSLLPSRIVLAASLLLLLLGQLFISGMFSDYARSVADGDRGKPEATNPNRRLKFPGPRPIPGVNRPETRLRSVGKESLMSDRP